MVTGTHVRGDRYALRGPGWGSVDVGCLLSLVAPTDIFLLFGPTLVSDPSEWRVWGLLDVDCLVHLRAGFSSRGGGAVDSTSFSQQSVRRYTQRILTAACLSLLAK